MPREVVPYKELNTGKKAQVEGMFDNISKNYDLLNHLLSAGIDIKWRKKAIGQLKGLQPKYILDIATGTADFAIEALSLNPTHITGVDISQGMLQEGQKKLDKLKLTDKVTLQKGDSENLPFGHNTFDAVIVAFGVRNFENLNKGLEGMFNVLKPGGKAVILEFSKPKAFPLKQLYNFYFKVILPLIGRVISKDNSAYTYLPESVQAFPDGNDFINILNEVGYKRSRSIALTFGICTIYIGEK